MILIIVCCIIVEVEDSFDPDITLSPPSSAVLDSTSVVSPPIICLTPMLFVIQFGKPLGGTAGNSFVHGI